MKISKDTVSHPTARGRKALHDIDKAVRVPFVIPGTKKTVYLSDLKEYTIERLTEVWLEVEEESVAHNAAETLKYACKYPLKPYKEAALYTLNSFFRILFFFRLRVWWWSRVKGYTVEQMNAVIAEGKKKILKTLKSYYLNMAFTVDMRTDWMKMTRKEAERYRAELMLAEEQLSSKSTPNTERQDDFSSVS